MFYLGQIRRCLEALIKYLGTKSTSVLISANDLLFNLKLEHVNLFKIARYLEKSRHPQKLLGFTNITCEQAPDLSLMEEDDGDFMSKHISSLSILQTFLASLNSNNGKIVAEWPSSQESDARSRYSVKHPTLRYVLLNPADKFKSVLSEAQGVVLAGGTLRPFSHIASELLDGNTQALQDAAKADEALTRSNDSSNVSSLITPHLTTFSCGHVIPPSHVFTTCLSSGPTSKPLDFRHTSRTSDSVCDELGRVVANLVNVVPSGIVVFLPSYSYESHLMVRWKRTGVLNTVTKKNEFIGSRRTQETSKRLSNRIPETQYQKNQEERFSSVSSEEK